MTTRTLQSIDDGQAEFVEMAVPLRVTVHLEAADILTLFSAPPTIIAAPGAGKWLIVDHLSWEWKVATGFYANGDGSLTYDGDHADPINGGGLIFASVFDITAGASRTGTKLPTPAMIQDFLRSAVENKPLVLVAESEDPVFRGGLVTSTLAAGGSGYAPGDTGVVAQNGGIDAVYEVDTVDGGGAVVMYHLSNGGMGYTTLISPASTAVTTGGGDGAFTVNVTEITSADGDLYLTVEYTIETLH